MFARIGRPTAFQPHETFHPMATSLHRFDLTNPQVLAEPHALFDQMRREEPVNWSESLSAWVVTSHALVTQAMREPALSNERAKTIVWAQLGRKTV